MKKFFLISAVLMLAVSYGYSQTYYYKAVATVNQDGVRKKKTGGYYVTFSNNKNTCYDSDKNGNKLNEYNPLIPYSNDRMTYYSYQKTHNGTHVYQEMIKSSYGTNAMKRFYYFSSDFSKMQYYDAEQSAYYAEGGPYTTEYIRTNGPQDDFDENIPTF